MIRPFPDRGTSIIEYGAGLLLVSAVLGGLLTTDVPSRVAAECRAAICQVFGESCPAGAVRETAGGETTARPGAAAPGDRAGGNAGTPRRPARPAREPIPKPTCRPGSGLPNTGGFELHAHNDYENRNPLQDALDNGATSVEADVYLDGDDLVLRHSDGDPSRGTLAETYVEGLRERAEENGGQIHPGRDAPFQLVIEIKDGGGEAYRLALDQIRDLPPGVQVVFSGGYPERDHGGWSGDLDSEIGRQPANVAFDIGPGENCSFPPELDPANPRYDPTYAKNFVMFNANWDDCDDLSQEELNALVAKAHQSGLKVRFWGGPDDSARLPGVPGRFVPCPGALPGHQGCEDDGENTRDAWGRQMRAGVDYLNTNHLGRGRTWLSSCGEDY